MSTGKELLKVNDLTVKYGAHLAVSNVDLTVHEQELVAVLGPNGAGKSSVARAISGLVKVFDGDIIFDGEDISTTTAHHRARLGIVYIPEGRGIFTSLTVAENLRMGQLLVKKRNSGDDDLDRIFEVFPALKSRLSQRAGTLSGGEQQMLALSRAIAVGARIVIADELSLGLAPRIVEDVFRIIGVMKEQGISIVLIEQFVDRALKLADTCVILGRGKVAWSGSAADARDEVHKQYMGTGDAQPVAGLTS